MRTFSIALCLAALAVIGIMMWPDPPVVVESGAFFDGANIVVRGTGNTLASIAEQVGRPWVFSYDPVARKAFCDANIIVEGELLVGDANQAKTVFEFNTTTCGDRKLDIRPTGTIRVTNAEFATVNRKLQGGICPRGYAVICSGEMIARDTYFMFVTGSFSHFLRDKARADIRNCKFEGGDTASFTTLDLNGKGVSITDCYFDPRGVGNNGISVGGATETPTVFTRCTFAGKVNALLNQGDADVVLLDCTFAYGKLKFSRATGSVAVKHTITFEVVDKSGKPVAGVSVSAKSPADAPIQEADGGRTDADGKCSIALTAYVANKKYPVRVQGKNTATPHEVYVRSSDDTVLAKIASLEIAEAARDGKPVRIVIDK